MRNHVTQKEIQLLQSSALFRSLEEGILEGMLEDERTMVCRYEKGESVYEPEEYSRSLAFLLEGSARVTMRSDSGSLLPLRILRKGDCFGVAALFNEGENYVTHIEARQETKILFFPEDLLLENFDASPRLALSYIRFQADRIRFLNRRIGLLAGSDSRDSLNSWLLRMREEVGEEFTLNISYSELASSLNISRSSLYRGLEELEQKNVIARRGRSILIRDASRLQ